MLPPTLGEDGFPRSEAPKTLDERGRRFGGGGLFGAKLADGVGPIGADDLTLHGGAGLRGRGRDDEREDGEKDERAHGTA